MSKINLSIDKEADSILLSNRSKLKKIFTKHLPNREGRIAIQELIKFCSNVRILQDLITPIDLKKTIAQQNLKQSINYLEFENLIKQIALQTFNNTAPLYDKLRMLMIHIRNPCKMHYQVSLSQNYNKEASDLETLQDPVEIFAQNDDVLKPVEVFDNFFKPRLVSASPVRDNDSQNKARARLKPEKSVSPINSIELLEKALKYKFLFKSNRNSKNLNELSNKVSISNYRSVSPANIAKLTEVRKSFEKFRSSFSSTVNTPPKSYTSKNLSASLNYINTVRKNTFQSSLVTRIIFVAWKKAAKDRVLRSD